MINKVILVGNLTRDPELRSTPSGTNVLSFGIAVNERRRNPQNGEWEDRANYFDCTMFGTRAEALSHYLRKGMKVGVEGRLQWRQWEKDGQRRSKVDIIVNEVEFMSSRDGAAQGNGGGSSSSGYGQSNSYGSMPPVPPSDAYSDEDIPF